MKQRPLLALSSFWLGTLFITTLGQTPYPDQFLLNNLPQCTYNYTIHSSEVQSDQASDDDIDILLDIRVKDNQECRLSCCYTEKCNVSAFVDTDDTGVDNCFLLACNPPGRCTVTAIQGYYTSIVSRVPNSDISQGASHQVTTEAWLSKSNQRGSRFTPDPLTHDLKEAAQETEEEVTQLRTDAVTESLDQGWTSILAWQPSEDTAQTRATSPPGPPSTPAATTGPPPGSTNPEEPTTTSTLTTQPSEHTTTPTQALTTPKRTTRPLTTPKHTTQPITTSEHTTRPLTTSSTPSLPANRSSRPPSTARHTSSSPPVTTQKKGGLGHSTTAANPTTTTTTARPKGGTTRPLPTAPAKHTTEGGSGKGSSSTVAVSSQSHVSSGGSSVSAHGTPSPASQEAATSNSSLGEANSVTISSGVLVMASCFGVLLFCAMMVLFGKKCFDSWQRRDYSKLDYLINGMYS